MKKMNDLEEKILYIVNAVELIGGEYEYDDPNDEQIIEYLSTYDLVDQEQVNELYKLSEEENSGIYDEYREIIEEKIHELCKNQGDINE